MHSKILALVSISLLPLTGCAVPETPADQQVVQEAPATTPEAELEAPGSSAVDETATSYKLAAVDGRLGDSDLYEQRFQQVLERCPNNQEGQLGDALYQATQVLDQRGITEDTLWAMESLLRDISPAEAGTFDCVEVLTLAVVLRLEQG